MGFCIEGERFFAPTTAFSTEFHIYMIFKIGVAKRAEFPDMGSRRVEAKKLSPWESPRSDQSATFYHGAEEVRPCGFEGVS